MTLQAELQHLGLSRRTVRLYVGTIYAAQRWFGERGWELATATADQMVEYLDTRPDSFASRNLMRAAFGHYWGITHHPRPPVKAIRVPPKPEMVCLALEPDDARILAKAARQRGDLAGLAVLLGIYQGMRRSEIATLPWSGVGANGWLTITGKGSKRRTIPLHRHVAEALEMTPRQGDHIFPGRFGGPCNPAQVWEWIRLVADEAGVGLVRPHWLRHTCLATANDNTTDLRSVQAFAGHSRPEQTSGYTRATKRRLQAVVDSLDY